MSYLTIARFEGDPDRLIEGYRRTTDVMDGVGRDHCLILHAGAKTEDGLLVVNLWPSGEESDAAATDPRRLAVLESHQPQFTDMSKEHHELEHCLVLGGGE